MAKKTLFLIIVGLGSVICFPNFRDALRQFQVLRLLLPGITPNNDTYCYGELGCLNIDNGRMYEWNMISNLLPLSRETINTRFLLYTSLDQGKFEILKVADQRTVNSSKFDPQKPTKIIIHGYNEVYRSQWIGKMRNELLKHGNYNVIVVDWQDGSGGPLYPQTVANARLVGMEIAHLIKHLKTYGLNEKHVHMIGFSLGAQVAGFAGYSFDGVVGRITALDPPDAYFHKMDDKYRLDPTDAELVDVIHTESRNLGLSAFSWDFSVGTIHTCGHMDFYPNGGQEQPGCGPLSMMNPIQLLDKAVRQALTCNHRMSVNIFTESINSKSLYMAHKCDNYENFLRGECFNGRSKNIAIMGYHADTSPAFTKLGDNGRNSSTLSGSKFYSSTASQIPYCRLHWKFDLIYPTPLTIEPSFQASIDVIWNGVNGISRRTELNRSQNLHNNENAKFYSMSFVVVFDENNMENLEEITVLSLNRRSTGMFPWICHGFIRPVIKDACDGYKIKVAYINYGIMEKPGKRKRLCPASGGNYAEIAEESTAVFIKC